MWIYPWHEQSVSAKGLADGLGIRRIKHHNSKFVGRPNRRVINYGATDLPENVAVCDVINPATNVLKASNKLVFFQSMTVAGGPRLPPWTDDPSEAIQWFNAGHEVVGRKLLNSSGGKGIVFFSDTPTIEDYLDLPLYTQYKKKKEEFRVHFFREKLLDIQKKLLRTHDDDGRPIDREKIDTRVRNLANGYVFGRNDITVPEDVIHQAKLAFTLSKLDFGAVDVIWNEHEQKAYVLEINTAPGLTGTTLKNYVTAFKELT